MHSYSIWITAHMLNICRGTQRESLIGVIPVTMHACEYVCPKYMSVIQKHMDGRTRDPCHVICSMHLCDLFGMYAHTKTASRSASTRRHHGYLLSTPDSNLTSADP
jgi:hypothetical protein